MISNKDLDEKASRLISEKKRLFSQAEKQTEKIINRGRLDIVLNSAIDHAIEQNTKIDSNSDVADKLIILDSYFDFTRLKKQILNTLQNIAVKDHCDKQFLIFKNQITDLVTDRLDNATKERLGKLGFNKIRVELSSDEYYLLPPNYMDEYVYIWVSNKLQEESRRDVKLANFISFMIVIPNLLGIFLYLFSSIQLLPSMFRSLVLVPLLISFISLIYGIHKRFDMKLIKVQLLKLLAVEKRERE